MLLPALFLADVLCYVRRKTKFMSLQPFIFLRNPMYVDILEDNIHTKEQGPTQRYGILLFHGTVTIYPIFLHFIY